MNTSDLCKRLVDYTGTVIKSKFTTQSLVLLQTREYFDCNVTPPTPFRLSSVWTIDKTCPGSWVINRNVDLQPSFYL